MFYLLIAFPSSLISLLRVLFMRDLEVVDSGSSLCWSGSDYLIDFVGLCF
jgi:hypothetical protein